MPDRSGPLMPTSRVLEGLIHASPADSVNLAWLIERLGQRAFGFVLLLLGVCGLIPVVSPAAGLLLAIPAVQMMRAAPAPIFPRRLAQRSIATQKLEMALGRVIPSLRYLETLVHPRWRTPFEATKRVIGGFVFMLGLCLLIPLPFSNIPVSLAVVLLAFAYLEEDGVLLACAMLIALALFAIAGLAIWSMVLGVGWLAG